MRERLGSLAAIVLLTLVAASSYWYARELRRPLAPAAAAPGTPDFEAARLVITQFDGEGRIRHKLFAEQLAHYADTDRVLIAAPRLVSFSPDQPRVEVRADRGEIEDAGARVHLHGQVDLRRAAAADAPPMRVRTEYLLAIPDQDRYQTDRPVEVEHGASRISADGGMQLDGIARSARFDGRVRIVLAPATEQVQ